MHGIKTYEEEVVNIAYSFGEILLDIFLWQTFESVKVKVLLYGCEFTAACLHHLLGCDASYHCCHGAKVTGSNIRQLTDELLIYVSLGRRCIIDCLGHLDQYRCISLQRYSSLYYRETWSIVRYSNFTWPMLDSIKTAMTHATWLIFVKWVL